MFQKSGQAYERRGRLSVSAVHPSEDCFFAIALGEVQRIPVKTSQVNIASRLADLLPRLISALVLMVLALAAWWLGGDIFIVTWLAAAIAVCWEWQSMIGGARRGVRVLLGGAALVSIANLISRMEFWHGSLGLALGTGFVAILPGQDLRLWAGSGMVYAGALIGSLCLLGADSAFGPRAILWLFAIVWGTDIFAYFGGRIAGGPKIWPRISPGKTWSGTLIGVTCGAILGTLAGCKGLAGPVFSLPVFGLSLVTAAVAQAGDLFESWMKRRFGVKDSSHLIPGHGGLMDRLDGFIAAAFFAVVFGLSRNVLFQASQSLGAGLFVWR